MEEFFDKFKRGDRVVMARHDEHNPNPAIGSIGTVVDGQVYNGGSVWVYVYWDEEHGVSDHCWMCDECDTCWPACNCLGVRPDTLDFAEHSIQNRFEVLK